MSAPFIAFISGMAVLASAIASAASTGIGSLLTPALSLGIDMRTAVVAVAAPHLVFNALRSFSLRQKIDWKILKRFGTTSAAGALLGAWLHHLASSLWISAVFAALLVAGGVIGLTGATDHLKLGKKWAWGGGALTGLFGGLTGEQGGIRAAALLGFDVSKERFVATATASAVVVDAVRLPVYLFTRRGQILPALAPAGVCMAGILIGLPLGARLLKKVPERRFAQVVSALLVLVGILMGVRLILGGDA